MSTIQLRLVVAEHTGSWGYIPSSYTSVLVVTVGDTRYEDILQGSGRKYDHGRGNTMSSDLDGRQQSAHQGGS